MTSSGGLDAGRVVIVGVGGATNSGKTTLAKRLLSMLPAGRGIMVHQDDFALPESELPWNEKAQARDWDHPVGTVSRRTSLKRKRALLFSDCRGLVCVAIG